MYRILVVDDEPHVRWIIARTLRGEGYTVVETPDGLSAWQLIGRAADRFDLVVTDSRMPGLTGSDLIERLRKLDPATRILRVSGSQPKDPVPPHPATDIPTLYKPFLPGELIQAVQGILGEESGP